MTPPVRPADDGRSGGTSDTGAHAGTWPPVDVTGVVSAPWVTRRWVLASVAALVTAESLVAFASPVAGAVAHSVLLLALLRQWVAAGEQPVLVLALLPLGRLTSLALTPADGGPGAYALTGAPLLLAVLLFRRAGLGPRVTARGPLRWPGVAVALSGIPIGFGLAPVLDVPAAADPASPLGVAAAAVAVFVFVGLLEEVLYRGSVQLLLEPFFGAWAIPLADLLFVAAYLPSRDAAVIAVVAVLGLLSGAYVYWSGRVAPVVLAHGSLAVCVLVVWPVLA